MLLMLVWQHALQQQLSPDPIAKGEIAEHTVCKTLQFAIGMCRAFTCLYDEGPLLRGANALAACDISAIQLLKMGQCADDIVSIPAEACARIACKISARETKIPNRQH